MSYNAPLPPPCIKVSISNPLPVIGIDNQYTCTLAITPQPIQGGGSQYDVANIIPGFWVSNYPFGEAWKIIEISNINLGAQTMDAVIEDVEYYNYSIDPDTGEHGPNDGAAGYCWTLAEDGLPNLFPVDPTFITTTGNYSYVTDLINRFRSRNYYTSYVQAYQNGSTFQTGQFLTITSTGSFQVATSSSTDVYNTIAVVTSSGYPTSGYFTYRPFGEFLTYDRITPPLTAGVGSVYYINSTGGISTTAGANSYPVYIQVSTGPTGGNGILLRGRFGQTSGGGSTGADGPQGFQGSIGPTGADGPQGVQGVQGFIGYQGYQGDVGPQGTQGFQGLVGFQGDVGPQGLIGETGPQGFQGLIGSTGADGPQGFQGLQGPQGLIGETGAAGVQGVQGYQGDIGFQGLEGFQGFQGLEGPQGLIGHTGAQGVQGVQGFQGFQGLIGHTGPQGLEGAQGFQGDIGFQGLEGAQGVQGFQGFQGLIGHTGPQGLEGFQGLIGHTGADGPQGVQGLIGATGTQGIQGPQGLEGSQGFQGIAGPTGSSGEIGFQGFQGIAGQNGLSSGLVLYMNYPNLSNEGGSLYDLSVSPTGGSTQSQTTTINGVVGTGPLLPEFLSLPNINNSQLFVAPGLWDITLFASTPDILNTVSIYAQVGIFSTGGSTTVLATTNSKIINSVIDDYTLTATIPYTNITLDDRVVINLFGQTTNSTGSNITTYYLDSTYSHVLTTLFETIPTGPAGPQGFQGLEGPQGFIGHTGAQGFQGLIGETGAQGFQGLIGETGAQGFQGLEGVQGPTGPQGDIGFQGFQGFVGFQGDVGPQGFQGETGAQGFQGLIGHTGADGSQGFQGLEGVQGPTGPQGDIGFQGVQGYVGFQGDVGPQGLIGETGPQGFQGIAGPTGVQGIEGSQGFQGFQGLIGETGAQGVQGVQGFQGLIGFDGATGPQGIVGFQGVQGYVGFQGDVGPQGFQGLSNMIDSVTGSFDNLFVNNLTIGTQIIMETGTYLTSTQDTFYVDANLNVSNIFTVNATTSEVEYGNYVGGDFIPSVTINGVNGTIYCTGSTGAGYFNYLYVDFLTGPNLNFGSNSTGPQGFQGIAGPTGYIGVDGTTGPQGFQGLMGPTGTFDFGTGCIDFLCVNNLEIGTQIMMETGSYIAGQGQTVFIDGHLNVSNVFTVDAITGISSFNNYTGGQLIPAVEIDPVAGKIMLQTGSYITGEGQTVFIDGNMNVSNIFTINATNSNVEFGNYIGGILYPNVTINGVSGSIYCTGATGIGYFNTVNTQQLETSFSIYTGATGSSTTMRGRIYCSTGNQLFMNNSLVRPTSSIFTNLSSFTTLTIPSIIASVCSNEYFTIYLGSNIDTSPGQTISVDWFLTN